MFRFSRRNALEVLTLLPFLASIAVGARPAAAQGTQSPSSRTLVAFFSRSGNTRVIAGIIHRDQATDIFEIKPAVPYPEDYDATVEQARVERDNGVEPALAGKVENIDQYETIYLGFPIWGETAPPVIRSFLRSHDLKGKTVRPFITHGGYGLGNSLSVLASHAAGARIEPEFSMEADQEKRTLRQVNDWLGRTPPG